jgi:hypothetical protein
MVNTIQPLIERIGDLLPKLMSMARERKAYWLDYNNLSQFYQRLQRGLSPATKSLALSYSGSLYDVTRTQKIYLINPNSRAVLEEIANLLEQIGEI